MVLEKDVNGINRLKYQFIEADQIYSLSTYNSSTGNEIRAGIEIERNTGKHVAYYINQRYGIVTGKLLYVDREYIWSASKN